MTSLEKALIKLRKSSSEARKLFDALREYQNNLTEITVDNFKRKTGLRPKQIRLVLMALEGLGVGTLIVGRRGGSTRFEWDPEFKYTEDIPGPQPGEPVELAVEDELVLKGFGNAQPAAVTEWTLSLVGRRKARLLLPADLKQSDVTVLREFLEELEQKVPV